MDNNTHTEISKIGNIIIFSLGVHDKCNHVWNGDPVYTSSKGKIIHWHTYRQWAHLTTQARYELIIKHHENIEDPIIEFTSSCSKCKKIMNPSYF